MPRYIVKPIRGEDFYATYSTVVDNFIEYGNRAEYLEQYPNDKDRLDRADTYGSSALGPWFQYDEGRFTISEFEGREDMPFDDDGIGYYTIDRIYIREWVETGNTGLLTLNEWED